MLFFISAVDSCCSRKIKRRCANILCTESRSSVDWQLQICSARKTAKYQKWWNRQKLHQIIKQIHFWSNIVWKYLTIFINPTFTVAKTWHQWQTWHQPKMEKQAERTKTRTASRFVINVVINAQPNSFHFKWH